MNKTFKLLFGLAALSLAACSNEEPVPGNAGTEATGDRAYLYVNISSTDDVNPYIGSRADGSINGNEFVQGDKCRLLLL